FNFSRRWFSDSNCRARGVMTAPSEVEPVSRETLPLSTKPASITLNLKYYRFLWLRTICQSCNCGRNFQEFVAYAQHFRLHRFELAEHLICLFDFIRGTTSLDRQ